MKEDWILIVDDEPNMCWVLEQILRPAGFSAERASCGAEALEKIRSRRFSLAFLDAKLPDIEGLELAGRIRILVPQIRILIVSGYFFRDDSGILSAMGEGVINGFISKPFNNNEILNMTLNLLC